MPVTAYTTRARRHVARSGRIATILRPSEETQPSGNGLTLTLNISVTGEVNPQTFRLIEAVRELVELGNGAITVTPSEPDADELLPEAFPETGERPEVRLLTASRQVLVNGVLLPLTRLEFDLLLLLAEHPRRVFSRAQLLAGVWGYEHTGERTVEVHVRRLRVKLGAQVPLITTVYGVGYRLSDEAVVTVLPHD